MKKPFTYLIAVLVAFLFSCNSSKTLIDKSKTGYGRVRFYSENPTKDNIGIKRIYAAVDSSGIRSYFSFYPEGISKTTETSKSLTYTLFYKQLPLNYDGNLYQKLSSMDSIVLALGDNLLDSMGLKDFRKSKGAEAFEIYVTYYHGYPKNKKLRP